MNTVIFSVTMRQLLGKRRTLLLVGFAALPILLAIIFRLVNPEDADPQRFAAAQILDRLGVGAVLPFIALVMGTAALGSDIEDGTAVYILAKPIPRWHIIVSKLLPAWIVSGAISAASMAISSGIVLWGRDTEGLPFAFAVAAIIGALLYCAVFLALSVFTSRALISGMVYVFVWEALITNFLPGTRLLSIREYTRSIADALSSTSANDWEARLGGGQALVLVVIVGVAAFYLAVSRLRRWEIGEST